MEQKKYTLAEAARILGEMFINMADSLEAQEETCSPECEKRCLGECDGSDKHHNHEHHNDSLDSMSYAMEAFVKKYTPALLINIRKFSESHEPQKEDNCKKESNISKDGDIKSLLEIAEEINEVVRMAKEDLIKKLSKETGFGLFECKDALIRCDYDYDEAKQYLKIKPRFCNTLT